jgi:hypothetical protein
MIISTTNGAEKIYRADSPGIRQSRPAPTPLSQANGDSAHESSDHDRLDRPAALRARKASFVSTGHGPSDLNVEICGFMGRPSEQRKIEGGMEQMDAEVVETVAGVARLLRRAAELAWTQADATGPRSSRQMLALGIDSAADEASGLLPRRARLDGPIPVGDNPAELLASAEQLLRRICVVGSPARLLGLRVLVAELVWEANTSAGA